MYLGRYLEGGSLSLTDSMQQNSDKRSGGSLHLKKKGKKVSEIMDLESTSEALTR